MEAAREQIQELIDWACEPAAPTRYYPRRASSRWQVGLVVSIALHAAAAIALVWYVPTHSYTPPQVLLARGDQGEGDEDGPESKGGSELGSGIAATEGILRVQDMPRLRVKMPELPTIPEKARLASSVYVMPELADARASTDTAILVKPPPLTDPGPDSPVLIARGMESPALPRAMGAAPVSPDSGLPISAQNAGDSSFGATGAGLATTQPSETAFADAGGASSARGNGAERTAVGAGGTGGNGGEGGTGRAARGRAGLPDGLDFVRLPQPIYPRESRDRGEQGKVVLQIEIRADGLIGEIKVISDAGYPRLAEAAIAAVRKARIRPAMEDGKPIAGTVTQTFNFVLRK